MSTVFAAKYRGICAFCDEIIYPGDDVTYDENDELVGVHCHPSSKKSPFAKPKTTSSNVCPVCNLDHAGECP